MAKKKTTKPKKAKKDLLNIDNFEEELKIESELQLETIQLKKLRWEVKVTVKTTLPRSYHRYKTVLDLDQTPYLKRIEDLEKELDGSLFANDPAQRKGVEKRVKEVREELDRLIGDTEKIEFHCTVQELKYKDSDTILLIRVPDDIIEPLNRQKSRLNLYKLVLYPTL